MIDIEFILDATFLIEFRKHMLRLNGRRYLLSSLWGIGKKSTQGQNFLERQTVKSEATIVKPQVCLGLEIFQIASHEMISSLSKSFSKSSIFL